MTEFSLPVKEIDHIDFAHSNYQLIEKIGEGGFAKVYKAKQLNTGQFVAIKFLTLPNTLQEDKKQRYINRFERETLLSGRLQHPNIVRLLDKGQCSNEHVYAVFEFISGESLKHHLAWSGSFNTVTAADIMAQILDALAHAHGQGVIHRDIKPANIMLTKTGAKIHAKILDFGIGTFINEQNLDAKNITLTNETLGTPSYSAPEQLRGEPATAKTDIYAWGLVFLECVTGHPAISGSSLASIFHKQLNPANVPLPGAMVDTPLGNFIRRTVNKNTNERAANASDLYQEFTQLNVAAFVGDLSESANECSESAGANTDTNLNQTQLYEPNLLVSGIAERKQITLCCIALSLRNHNTEAADIEIIDALHRDQKASITDTAARYGGFHLGTLGNTLLFCFGYPSVTDNDCRLCARTALEVHSQLQKRNAVLQESQGLSFTTRTGIHTGLMAVFSDTPPEGDALNIAMDLMRQATHNQILCSGSSQKILDGYIEFSQTGIEHIGANNIETPVYSLLSERMMEASGFLRGIRRHYTLFGRNREMAEIAPFLVLSPQQEASQQKAPKQESPQQKAPKQEAPRQESPQQAAAQSVQWLHVHGEAGIGKSRLISEVRGRAREHEHLVAQCLPEYKNNALMPVLALLRHKLSISGLSQEMAAKRLSRFCHNLQSVSPQSALTLLSSWLNLPMPENSLAATDNEPNVHTLAPEAQKSLLFDCLVELLFTANSSHPQCLFIVEDLHWIDPTSLEFINYLTRQQRFCSASHLLLSTSRQPLPESTTAQSSKSKSITLPRLNEHDATDFVRSIFNHKALADDVIQFILERTDGIPLFIEELASSLKQGATIELLNGVYRFNPAHSKAQIPGTLREFLQQKLDSLPDAKETAQMAAVIGREFDLPLLFAASKLDEAAMQSHIEALQQAELIYVQRNVSTDKYLFKHALVRDAAYESMPAEQQRTAHKAVADTYQQHFPHMVTSYPGVLAQHYGHANEYATAVNYGLKSITNTVKNGAYNEALSTSDLNRHWIEKLSNPQQAIELEIQLYTAALPAMVTLEGYSSPKANEWANGITSVVENNTNLLSPPIQKRYAELVENAEWIKLVTLHESPHRKQAREFGDYLRQKYQQNGNTEKLLITLSHLSQAQMFDGDLALSADGFERAISLFDEQQHQHLAAQYSLDVLPYCSALVSLNYLHMGKLNLAIEKVRASMEYGERKQSRASIVIAYIFYALCEYLRGNESKVIELGDIYYQQHDDVDNPMFYRVYLDVLYCSAKGNLAKARELIEPAARSEAPFATGWYIHFIAKKHLERQEFNTALELLNLSLSVCERVQEYASMPIVQNALAWCLFKQRGVLDHEIQQLLNESLQATKQQQAHFFTLEALTLLQHMQTNAQERLATQQKINKLTSLFGNQSYRLFIQNDIT